MSYFGLFRNSNQLFDDRIEMITPSDEDIFGSSNRDYKLSILHTEGESYIKLNETKIEIGLINTNYNFDNPRLEYLGGQEYLLILESDSIFLKN